MMTQKEKMRIEMMPCTVCVEATYEIQNGRIREIDRKDITIPAIVLTRALCDLFGVDLDGGAANG